MAGKKTKVTPPKKAAASTNAAPPPNKLPAALVKRAEQQAAAKRARLAKEARDDIALIRRRQAEIAEAFYDIGEALVRLKRPDVAQAAGRASFKELCEKDLEMSVATANRLITIVTQVPREDALRMGQQRSLALAELAKVTPEPDTAAQLDKATRKLPSGKKVDLGKASAREIDAAAKELRGSKASVGRRKGKSTTEAERTAAAAAQAALHGEGFDRVRVTAVATRPGQDADVRIEGVPVTKLRAFARALARRA